MESPAKKKPKPPPPQSAQPVQELDFFDDNTGRFYFFNESTGQSRWAPNNIITDGLPELGPLSQSTRFTSNPSVPTDDQHKPANLTIKPFSTLSDLPEFRYPTTNIWQMVIQEKGNLGGYSNEAGVNSQVERVVIDVLESLGVRGEVTIRAEVEVMRNRPDFMLILVNGHPIGTIEGKQPGEVAMHHPNILGEVYDHLTHLSSIFRVNNPFAILTSYEEWRICWLNNEASNALAESATIPESTPFQTPTKKKTVEEEDSLVVEQSSPLPPPTPSREKSVGKLQEVEEDVDADVDGQSDDGDRVFCGTDAIPWNERSLPTVLASVIRKMMMTRQGAAPKVLRLANAESSAWKKPPPQSNLNFELCISRGVRNFYLWEDLGHGAGGRAFLVSGGTKGAVGVLKFFFGDPDSNAQHEANMWHEVYSDLPPVKAVQTVQVMGQVALLMPWFQSPNRTQLALDAVEKTLREDFMDRGLHHGDVAWRNVGVYSDVGETKAVVFDMQKVRRKTNPGGKGEDWVTTAVSSLATKLED